MSESRYTVTEGQLIVLANIALSRGYEGRGFTVLDLRDFLSTLTPDPEPSGEVVDIPYFVNSLHKCLSGKLDSEDIRKALLFNADLLTAEVTRQVEERTKGYREALEFIADRNDTPIVQKTVAQQALVNKGGSDD